MKTKMDMAVVDVGRDGAKISVRDDSGNSRKQWIAWAELRSAARQDDLELRAVYSRLLATAEDMAADGPVVVSVGQDSTNVWWSAGVSAYYGGGRANYHRLATEGGTHPNHMLAAAEADDICQRLGGRVVSRQGFDGPAAKAQIAKILARS